MLLRATGATLLALLLASPAAVPDGAPSVNQLTKDDQAAIMKASLAHIAGEQNFGHHRVAGRRSCVAREMVTFRGTGEDSVAAGDVVGEMNTIDPAIEQVQLEPPPAGSARKVELAWLHPSQALADDSGSCGDRTREIISVSLPQFSAPDSAQLYFSLVCGMLCGTGEVLTLERKEGAWRVISRDQQWVS